MKVCVLSCHSYPACAVLFCHLWPVWFYKNFSHFLTNGTIFGTLLLNIKFVFSFSLQICLSISQFRKNSAVFAVNALRSLRKVSFIFVGF